MTSHFTIIRLQIKRRSKAEMGLHS